PSISISIFNTVFFPVEFRYRSIGLVLLAQNRMLRILVATQMSLHMPIQDLYTFYLRLSFFSICVHSAAHLHSDSLYWLCQILPLLFHLERSFPLKLVSLASYHLYAFSSCLTFQDAEQHPPLVLWCFL
ncbi:hypothetical protein NDU88_009468, partial [Pleurodeles waltl]